MRYAVCRCGISDVHIITLQTIFGSTDHKLWSTFKEFLPLLKEGPSIYIAWPMMHCNTLVDRQNSAVRCCMLAGKLMAPAGPAFSGRLPPSNCPPVLEAVGPVGPLWLSWRWVTKLPFTPPAPQPPSPPADVPVLCHWPRDAQDDCGIWERPVNALWCTWFEGRFLWRRRLSKYIFEDFRVEPGSNWL